MEFLDKIQN